MITLLFFICWRAAFERFAYFRGLKKAFFRQTLNFLSLEDTGRKTICLCASAKTDCPTLEKIPPEAPERAVDALFR